MPTVTTGHGVRVTEGPMQGIYGMIIMFEPKQEKYLVRFTGQQQMFYDEADIQAWE